MALIILVRRLQSIITYVGCSTSLRGIHSYLFIFKRFSTRILPALEIAWLFYTYGLYIDELYKESISLSNNICECILLCDRLKSRILNTIPRRHERIRRAFIVLFSGIPKCRLISCSKFELSVS